MITQVGKGGVIRPTVVLEEDLVDFEGRAEVAEELAEFTESLLDTRIPIGRTINNIPLDQDIVLTPEILGTYDRATIDQKIDTAESSGYVPVKINGHLLDTNVNLTAADLDAYSAQEIDSKLNFVPGTRTVNGKPLSADVTLAPGDVGAPTKTSVDATAATIVPVTRKVNGKALSADIELLPGDIGAPSVADVVPRTFTINGQPMVGTEMTVTLDAEAYTKSEIDTKLRDYIPLANNWGLGTAPKIDQTITESGFHGYTAAAPHRPTGSEKGTVAAIVSDAKTYALAFPEDQLTPQYYDGTWHAIGGGVKAPIPDVWLPLENSLRMITGEGPYDKVTINGSSMDLNTKSAEFTRASTATYISNDGVVKYAAVNEPRFEKDGLLIEWQSTNQITSQVFTSVAGQFEATSGQESPDGLTNGTRIKSVGNPVLTKPFVANSGPVTLSWFFKPINATTLAVLFRNSTKNKDLVWEDISIVDGVATISNPNSTLTKLANGWYRHTLFQPVTPDMSDGDAMVAYFGLPGGSTTGREYLLFGMQVELGPCATSYIPTAGTAVTRANDTCSIQVPGNFPGKDFTLAMNTSYRAESYLPYRRMLFTSTSYYALGFQRANTGATTGGGQAFVYMGQNGDSGVYKPINGLDIYNFDQSKPVVVKVSPSSVISINNGKAFSPIGVTPTMPLGQRLYLGCDPTEGTGSYLNGHIRNVRIWLNPLPTEQIGALV